MKFKTRILQYFEIEPGFYRGSAFRKYAQAVREAMEDQLFLLLVGDRGSGKKTVIGEVVKQIIKENERGNTRHHIVYIELFDDTRVTIAQIVREMILELTASTEGQSESNKLRIRSDFYSRKRQLAAIIGKLVYSEKHKVTLIIRQAQHLHGATLRALKELREISFLDRTEMFAVVLTGHPSLSAKVMNMEDVWPRTEIERLEESAGWMIPADRQEYLKAVWGSLLDKDMRELIAGNNHTPLAMDRCVYDALQRAYRRGDRNLKAEDFMDMSDLIKRYGIPLQEIADAAGVSKSTAGLISNNKTTGFKADTVANVQSTIGRLIAERNGGRKQAV